MRYYSGPLGSIAHICAHGSLPVLTSISLRSRHQLSHGAAVMISPKEGVLGKLRNNVNSKIFATHCPPHRLVLACKEGQKEIPSEIEKTVSDTLFFFKDSSVRRDEFTHLVEPESPHIRLVQSEQGREVVGQLLGRLVRILQTPFIEPSTVPEEFSTGGAPLYVKGYIFNVPQSKMAIFV